LVDADSKGLELGWTRTRLEHHSKGLDSSHCSRGLGLEARRIRNDSSSLIAGLVTTLEYTTTITTTTNKSNAIGAA